MGISIVLLLLDFGLGTPDETKGFGLSMRDYQPPETLAAYSTSAVFMEIALEGDGP